MGYMMAIANCGNCGALFSFNPLKVPSYKNVPFCKICVDNANPQRIKNGLQPITYAPDTYEPVNEYELP